jgi:hypothetical protein
MPANAGIQSPAILDSRIRQSGNDKVAKRDSSQSKTRRWDIGPWLSQFRIIAEILKMSIFAIISVLT